jgi:hypothetical protein
MSHDAAEPQQREFVQAALITDLPTELLGALSQGLSQFGINLPPMPTSLLTGSGASPSPGLMSPGLTAPGLTSPGLTAPGLTSPGLTPPSLTTPGLTAPGLTTPGLTAPGLTVPGATTPGLNVPPATATGPSLTDAGLANPGLTNPALTSPTAPGLTTPGLTSPPAPGLTTPGLTTPISNSTGLGIPGASEIPISAPIGLDQSAGMYPILGDPSLGMPMAPAPSGGLLGDLSSAAQTLGAGQAIDLLKGMVMPAITSAMQGAVPAAPAAIPAPAP